MVINKKDYRIRRPRYSKYLKVDLKVRPRRSSRIKKFRGYKRRLLGLMMSVPLTLTSAYLDVFKEFRYLERWERKTLRKIGDRISIMYPKLTNRLSELRSMMNKLDEKCEEKMMYVIYDSVHEGLYDVRIKFIGWSDYKVAEFEVRVTRRRDNSTIKFDISNINDEFREMPGIPFKVKFSDWWSYWSRIGIM